MSEVTTLPTEPQPLPPKDFIILKCFHNIGYWVCLSFSIFEVSFPPNVFVQVVLCQKLSQMEMSILEASVLSIIFDVIFDSLFSIWQILLLL